MSKKKAFSGSTMSLKDFHGGSIPSDLRLPSAPGVIARSGSDRQNLTPWGNNLLRPDNRTRPKSSGAAINLDEKASFLSHPSSIGRNFDEDERKPLDGMSVPRRTISDESIRADTPPIRQESKPDHVSSERHAATSVSQIPNLALGFSPVKLVGVTPVGVNSQTPSGNSGQTMVNSHQNAWGMRKEVMGVGEAGASSVLSGPNVESKFAQASALEKVSSGKWQPKSPMQLLPHLICSRNNDNSTSSGVDLVSERGDYDVTWGSHAERDWIAEDEVCGSGKQLPSYAKERPQMCAADALAEPNFGGAHSQPVTPSEISARSKIKLLPRSKPLEISETDQKKGYQQSIYPGKVESVNEIYGNTTPKSGSAVGEGGNQPVDRPKLNLKPRSMLLEQSKGSPERERNTLFGGARPRELVLKERGIDDVAINNLDLRQLPNRVNDSPKIEAMRDHSTPTARQSEQTENLGPGKRIGRDSERKERWMDHERADNQRNWRNDNGRRSSRDAEKQPQPLQQDKRPEPETWRKPVEQPKPTSPDDAAGIRPGKVTSALELAQTFSRSFSDPKKDGGLSGQRSSPGQNQTPFSRLTDARDLYSTPSARPHINGY